MRLVRSLRALLLSIWALLALLGCDQSSTTDCTTLQANQTELPDPALADSLVPRIADACNTFEILSDSLELILANPDSTVNLSAFTRSQLYLDQELHQILANAISDLLTENPPANLAELTTALAKTSERLDTIDNVVRIEVLEDHRAAFDSAKTTLALLMESRQLLPLTPVVELGFSLTDSLHTILYMSLQREMLTYGDQSSPALDSLSTTLALLIALRATRIASNVDFIDEVSGARFSLGGAEERAQTHELIWQLYRATNLLQSALEVLEASIQFAVDEIDLSTGLLLLDAVARLENVADNLAQNTAAIEDAQRRIPAPDADSLRLSAARIQDDLLRQERSLVDLQVVLSSLDEAALQQRPLLLLSNTSALLNEVHQDMILLNDALSARLGSDLGNYGIKVFLSILFVLAGLVSVRFILWLLNTVSERSARRRLFYKRLIPVTRLVVIGLTTYIVLAYVFGLDQRSLLAAGAVIGVAVGFAAQNILKNIFGGIIIIFDQPFQVGDKIRIGETYGEVASIGLRATRIVTSDDNLVSVPNAHVIDSQVANANAGALHCQVVVELYVPGWADTTKVKSIAHSAAANSKYVYLGKPIVVNVRDEFKETFLTQLAVKAYVLDTRYEFAFASDVTEAAKAEFRKQGYFDRPIGHVLPLPKTL
ncbi:MAG: mechanosensitive ion channel [Bacteroidetes bacterium]|nr:mechanosensitive ion channel [Bacteroidota bacterium]